MPTKEFAGAARAAEPKSAEEKMKIVYLLIICIKCKGQMFTEKENKVQLT